MTEEKFEQGLDLSQRLDRSFTEKYNLDKVNAYSDMYDDAVRLMKSKDLKAFDLNQNPKPPETLTDQIILVRAFF